MNFTITQMTASSIFLIIYGFIISEKVDKAIISLIGAVSVVFFGLLSGTEVLGFIDFGTLSLLVSMMILVSITKKTGVFQYIAYRLVDSVQGNPIWTLVWIASLTALFSAFLDNVTTVIILVPISLMVCKTLEITPIPFLFAEIFAANIGGTATLIGDPPNIMIGSAVGLSFMDFIYHLAPIVLVIFIVTISLIYLIYRKQLIVSDDIRGRIQALGNEVKLKDRWLIVKSLIVLGLTLLGFMFHQVLGVSTATIAIVGALLLMLISRVNTDEVFREVEWGTIFFFVGLFIMVGSLEKVGILDVFANLIVKTTGGNVTGASSLTLWGSGLFSGFVDNIPYVATAIPVIKDIVTPNSQHLWWALSLGACLGGNMTAIGASANVIVLGMANKNGIKIGFIDYLKVGVPLTILSLLISQIYLYVRYLL